MLKSKVLDIFRSLSQEELKKFRDFVRSPYHNRNKNVISLFETIRKFSPAFNEYNLKKEKIYRKVFPGKPYNDIVIRILLSDLNKIAEEYLVQLRLEKSNYDYKKFLLSEFMDRKIDKLFLKVYNNGNNGLSTYNIDDSFFKYKFDIEELNKGFNIDRNVQHLNSSNLVDMGKYLIIFFLMKMSSVVHDIDVNKSNFNTIFEEGAFDSFLNILNLESIKNLIKNEDFKDNEILELYFCSLMLNSPQETDNYYYRLKELFYKNISSFEHGTAYNMYLALLNYNGKKHWDDKSNKYRKEAFELYKDMLERGIYSWSKSEYMTVIIFRSILTLCSMLNEIEWMENFINNNIDKLEPAQRKNMYHYSYAKLNFIKKDYNKALENITKVDFNLFTFKFDVKTLMLQIYYELGYYEEAYTMMDSFKHFLRNNKNVSPVFKEWNINFLNLYTDLICHKSDRRKNDLDLLRKKICDTSNAASQNWLKNKVEELI